MSSRAAAPSTRPVAGPVAVQDPPGPADGAPRLPGRTVEASADGVLWVSHGLVPLAVGAGFLAVAAIERGLGSPGVVVAGVLVAAIVAWRARILTAASAGVVAWSGASALLGLVVVLAAGASRASLSGVAAGFAVVATAGLVAGLCWRPAGIAPALPARVRLLARATFEPPRAWAAWIIGGGLAAPLAALYAPIILDVDSAWVVMAAERGHEEGLAFLQRTQDVMLPQIVFGPILRAWGYQGAIAATIAMVVMLAAFTAAFAFHLTRRPLGAFVAAGSLLAMPPIVGQASRLPMYAAMLLLGYGGALLVHQAMATDRRRPWRWAVAGGVALALAPEAHSLGQLFLVVPFLLLVLHPTRHAVRVLGATIAAVVVTSIPRLWINLSIGGLTRVRSSRTDWLVEEGYLRMINEHLHDQRSNDGPLAYLGNVPHLLRDAFGMGLLILLVALVVVAAVRAQRRTVVFGVVVVAAFLVALVVAAPGTYSRYLSPLGVGAAVVAGCGASVLDAGALRGRWRAPGRWLAVTSLAAVVLLATVEIGTNVRHHQADVRRLGPELTALADHIPPGEGVMGVRSNLMVYVDPNLRTLYGRTMSEKDFVTYLTWPSDRAVIDIMRRLGVTWVVVRDSKFVETTYHETWLRPVYDKHDRHAHRINESDRFCRKAHINRTVLYRIGSCKGRA